MNAPVPDPALTQPDPDGGVEFTDEEWAALQGEAPTGAGEVGLGDAIRTNLVARPHRDPGLRVGALADRADELEREASHIDCAPLETARTASDAANRNHEWGQARLRERNSARELLAARDAQVERVRALHRHGPDHLCTVCSEQYPCETYLAVGGTQ